MSSPIILEVQAEFDKSAPHGRSRSPISTAESLPRGFSASGDEGQPPRSSSRPSSPSEACEDANLETLQAELVGCSRSGDVARAEELLAQIRNIQGSNTSVDDYNVVIHTFTQAGDMYRVEKYLTFMEEHGPSPNLRSYNSVVNACAADGDVARAERALQRMKAHGIEPNYVTYSTICKVFGRKGAVSQIEQVMKLVESQGTPLNEYFYASLISACGATEPPQVERAERALGELVSRGLKPQSVKRALSRVVGEERTAHLLMAISQARTAASAATVTLTSSGARAPQAPLPPGAVGNLSAAACATLADGAAPAAHRADRPAPAASAHKGGHAAPGPPGARPRQQRHQFGSSSSSGADSSTSGKDAHPLSSPASRQRFLQNAQAASAATRAAAAARGPNKGAAATGTGATKASPQSRGRPAQAGHAAPTRAHPRGGSGLQQHQQQHQQQPQPQQPQQQPQHQLRQHQQQHHHHHQQAPAPPAVAWKVPRPGNAPTSATAPLWPHRSGNTRHQAEVASMQAEQLAQHMGQMGQARVLSQAATPSAAARRCGDDSFYVPGSALLQAAALPLKV